MFKKSVNNQQLDVFSSPIEHLPSASMNYYLKNDSWHNLFRKQVVMRVDESIFSVLYDDKNGAPNASLRVLVGMMLLKEGHGWSDEQLFENANYNLLIRSALGLMNLEDTVPVASTYYLFRKKLVQYNRENDVDLFKKCQDQITAGQILEFNVSGRQVRMDSKLLGSNIAWLSRYELIHETLRLFIEEREEFIYRKSLSKAEFSLIESIQQETGNKVVYRSTNREIDTQIVALGKLMYRFVLLFKSNNYGQYQILKTVFEQQYSVSRDKVVLPLEKEKISAKSIQSPHDIDAHFRNKDGNKVKGYSANVTETCDQKGEDGKPVLNLITDTQVEVVSTQDNTYLQKALANTQEIVPEKIESAYADGAYNSVDNQEYCQNNDISLVLTAMQGATPGYEVSLDKEDNNKLIVKDNKTGNLIQAEQVKTRSNPTQKKWRIKTQEGKYRYFDMQSVRAAALRQKLREIPIEQTNIRNNVEATIFQLGYHYSNDKSRYRGLAKHKLWAYSRSLWINFVRIMKYVTQLCQRTLFGQNLPNNIVNICFKMQIIISAFDIKILTNKNPKIMHFSTF
ncbi:MAG: transposase [Candidatus Moranbacteria bacterium]|nr:transposase [Candidatus Moranbacteria bacterium]